MNHQYQKTKLHSILLAMAFLAFSCVPMVQAQLWDQIHKLLAFDGDVGDAFGSSVAISGNIVVIGAPSDDDNGINSGSAYVFDVTTGQQIFKLLAANGSLHDMLGISIAVSGNLAVIGADGARGNTDTSGSAYIFDINTGQQISNLYANDGVNGDQFGESVAISGNIAVIGAPFNNENGTLSGSAYVFDVNRDRLFKLLASDGVAQDRFGVSVAVSGSLAVIGTIGNSAYVFDVTTGQQLFKLQASDGAIIGSSVAISGNLAVIGAPHGDGKIAGSGSAYVFDVTTGQQLFKMIALDGVAGDNFGNSVAISGNLAVIGALLDDDNGERSGSAYVFNATTGQQLSKLLASDGSINDTFGLSVAVSGNFVLSGAPLDDDHGTDSGSSYVFQQLPANSLTITPTPLIAKQDGTFTITQTLPSEQTWLIYSLDGLQKIFVRQLNVVIDLANPKIAVPPRLTDANGDLQFILPMPGVQSPVDVWFQAVQHRNVTNFVPTQVIP